MQENWEWLAFLIVAGVFMYFVMMPLVGDAIDQQLAQSAAQVAELRG